MWGRKDMGFGAGQTLVYSGFAGGLIVTLDRLLNFSEPRILYKTGQVRLSSQGKWECSLCSLSQSLDHRLRSQALDLNPSCTTYDLCFGHNTCVPQFSDL